MISSRSWGFHECSYLVHHEFSEQPSYYFPSFFVLNEKRTTYEPNMNMLATYIFAPPIVVIHYTKTSFTTWIYQNASGGSYNKCPHIRRYILTYATEVTRMYMFMALCMCVPAFWLDDFPSMGLFRNFASWMSVMANSCRQQPGSWSDLPLRLYHGARGQLQTLDDDWWGLHDLADRDPNGQSDSLSAVTSQSTRYNCELRDSCKQGTRLQIMCCDSMAAILDYCKTVNDHLV